MPLLMNVTLQSCIVAEFRFAKHGIGMEELLSE